MVRWLTVAACGLAVSTIPADPSERLVRVTGTQTVVAGDTLSSIGARYGIDPHVLAADNDRPVRQLLQRGETIALDIAHIVPAAAAEGMVTINIPQRMLFDRTGDRVLAFPVAVGSPGWPSPLGPFTIEEKELDPTWDVPASIAREAAARGIRLPDRVPPGPDNPLGRHWLRLSVGGVGVHGTNTPSSIYQAVTHGCIRAHPDDVARLFERVDVGTPGLFVYEPVLLTVERDVVYLEVHRDVYRKSDMNAIGVARALAALNGVEGLVDWGVAARVAAARDGIARPVSRR